MTTEDPLIGHVLAHYRVIARLGTGGMGVVYRAEDVRLHRGVALKVISGVDAASPQAIERLYLEARAASALNHPNICTIYDVDTDQGQSFVVMELLEGQTLRDRIAGHALPVGDAIGIARQIAEALEAAHRSGTIHRDVKPANIFLTTQGSAKVLDFGLAKRVAGLTDVDATHVQLTNSGVTLGTVPYMSTEQICGEVLDARTDIFSFGAVFWEMLTGQPPFGGKTSALVFDDILHRDPVPPSAISPSVPPAIDAIVARALQKNRTRRYQSFGELLADLRQAPVSSDTSSAPQAVFGSTAAITRPRTRKPDSTKSRGLHALAVLPFANTANDPEIEYLSDGITETIINKLSQIGGLRVVPRSTVFRYKGRELDPVAVGAELKAKSVVIGRVLQRSGRLVVTVELVNVRRHAQLWGEQYNRTTHDILDVQESIAAEVSAALEVKLTGDDRRKLARRDTQDSVAYQAYIKGRFYWNKRTVEGLLQAIEHFQAAIAHDPQYARALAGLADTFNILGYYNGRPPADVYPQGKAAAARALEIDPAMAEAHASLGYARLFFDRDWSGAEQSFLEAIRLNPGYASAHQWYGWLLMVTRRWDEMMAAMQRAHDLDPLSLVINEHYGYALSLVGRADEAVRHLQATVDLDPHFALAHLRIGAVHLSQGRMDEAIAALRTAVRLSSGQFAVGALGFALGSSGQRAEAEQLLEQLRERSRRLFVSPLESAYIHAGLDQADETFEAIEQAVAQRVSDVVRIGFLPWTPAIRADPRFSALLATIGLPGKGPDRP